jgi:hypothetical protein
MATHCKARLDLKQNNSELFAGRVQFREFDADAAAAELSVRIPELEAELAKLEEAQIVTNEALLLEFSV